MGNYYDVTFHTLDGGSIIRRGVYSERDENHVWEDAVEAQDADHLYIRMNGKTLTSLLRRAVVRIDMQQVEGDADKQTRRRDEFVDVVNQLSQMGL
ncbi:chromosome partitioning protein ParB [Lactiplantibacillus daowaiensis]|uniref:Chromosome partitioning protein ParB n=1 Tax=Lactiplantibacillus daowaiensis TaxID=2559918 RepID=A0ABW1S3C0_9LACO|nr:chromosome partitioning protein ParB [Lactiplantibacillus daowaiensis]